jgi:hypothetical protein
VRDALAPERIDVGPLDTHRVITLRMTPGLSIRGQVVDAEGLPAQTLVMTVDGRVSTNTSRDGRFELAGLGPGLHAVQASASGGMGESDVVEAQAGTGNVVLRIPATGSLRIHVLAEGAPVASCEVQVLSDRPNSWFWSAAGGSPLTVNDLAEGTYTLLATAGDELVSEPVVAQVLPGREALAELVLGTGATL